MKTIGFANKYYTLWEVSKPYKVYINQFQFYEKQDFVFIQNLSKTLEGAKAKLQGQEYAIDLSLRGQNSFTRILDRFEDWQFTFGKLIGQDIRTCTDIFQLKRAMEEERPGKAQSRREIAKARLIELGELVEYKGEWLFKEAIEARKQLEYKESAVYGHHFQNGEKVELDVVVDDFFDFKTQYGTCYVVIYREIGTDRIFKYVGSSAAIAYDNEGNYVRMSEIKSMRIKGTIEHSNYKGKDETKIKRVKILSFERQ